MSGGSTSAPLFRPRPGLTYEKLVAAFAWSIPSRFNLGVACADVHPPRNPALIVEGPEPRVIDFGELRALSNRLGNGLRGIGIGRGDRVGIVIPQSLETGLMHLALSKIGAVALPLASLFGPDALAYRLGNSDAAAVVTTEDHVERVAEAAALAGTPQIVVVGKTTPPHVAFDELLGGADRLDPVDTAAEDPAFLIYTSGTTGPPKGALHAHRAVFGHLPGFELYYEFFPQPGDVIWTPADWAWIGALMDVVIPAWFYGKPVLTAGGRRFDPEWAADLMARHAVTAAFLPPTALKMMRGAGVSRRDLDLRVVFTGGEALGAEMLAYGEEHLGARINEGYGQTECNLVAGNCGSVWPVRPGSMGRPIPGHDVVVVDGEGRPLVGEVGEIAVRAPDPVMMLEYWNDPEATAAKYHGDLLLTGDLALQDDDGYLWFVSRKDDIIISGGYRIGPAEIEECLMGHPAVAMAAVVGVPDDIRGEVVKAFVVAMPDAQPSEALAGELRDHVRTRLAAHEVPRFVEFIDELPTTTTGKIMRRSLRA